MTLEDKPSAPPRGRGTAVGVTSGHMRGVASVRGRPRSAPPRTHDKKLHRAHRCAAQQPRYRLLVIMRIFVAVVDPY